VRAGVPCLLAAHLDATSVTTRSQIARRAEPRGDQHAVLTHRESHELRIAACREGLALEILASIAAAEELVLPRGARTLARAGRVDPVCVACDAELLAR
jgi:hypothetical protein